MSAMLAFGMVQTAGLRSPMHTHPPPALWMSAPRRQEMGGRLSGTLRAKETVEEEAARRGGGRGTKGLYVRPSKALEVGGGFYVPGLEGYRLRLAIVGLIVTLLTLNRLLLPGYEPLANQVVSETITGVTAAFVLVQALFDATFKGGAVVADDDDASPAAEAAPAAGAVAAGTVYVDPSASAESRDRLQWLVAAALQTVQAGSSTLVVGTRSRVAAAGAGASAPSAAQVDGALGWAASRGGSVKLVARGAGDDADVLWAALPAAVAQALVAVSDVGDVAVVVGLRASRQPVRADGNEQAWLKILANLPLP